MNLACPDFMRTGMGKVPDAKTLARIAQALGGEVIAELHRRLVGDGAGSWKAPRLFSRAETRISGTP
jgi:hypothetical protein